MWSATATRLKRAYVYTQRGRLILTLVAAAFSAGAALLTKEQAAQVWLGAQLKVWAGIPTAMALALIPFVSRFFLGTRSTTDWMSARAVSELLKRHGYTYAAGAAPFHDPATRAELLKAKLREIEKDSAGLLGVCTEPGQSRLPRTAITRTEYIKQRLNQQSGSYYIDAANRLSVKADRWRRVELFVGLVSAIAATITTVKQGDARFFAFITLLTTASTAIAVHLAAEKYDLTALAYRATAMRLKLLEADDTNWESAPSEKWSAYVEECEAIIAEENGSWVAQGSAARKSAAPVKAP
jgi:hypothetical protein